MMKFLNSCAEYCVLNIDIFLIKLMSIFNGLFVFFLQSGFDIRSLNDLVTFLPITVGAATLSYIIFIIIDKFIRKYNTYVKEAVDTNKKHIDDAYRNYIDKLEEDNARLLNKVSNLEKKIDNLTQELIDNE